MNLSKLILNPYCRVARNDLVSPYELHRTLVTQGFPDEQPEDNRMLFRIEPPRSGRSETGIVVLVQCSDAIPDWTHLPEDYCVQIEGPRDVELSLVPGQRLAFRLIANPVVKSKRREELGKNGQPKHKRAGLLHEDQQLRWLQHKGIDGGFQLLYAHTSDFQLGGRFFGKASHEVKRSLPHFGVRFDGLLEVTDPDKLVSTVSHGVGPAKAFGFGLLSLAKPL